MNAHSAFALGDANIGKHSFVHRVMYNQFIGREIEVGNVNKQVIVDDEVCIFSVTTVTDSELDDHFIRIAEGIFLMYSITSRRSFDNLVNHLNLILRLKAR